MLSEKVSQPTILCLIKLPFMDEGIIKTSTDVWKTKDFVTSRSILKMLSIRSFSNRKEMIKEENLEEETMKRAEIWVCMISFRSLMIETNFNVIWYFKQWYLKMRKSKGLKWKWGFHISFKMANVDTCTLLKVTCNTQGNHYVFLCEEANPEVL